MLTLQNKLYVQLAPDARTRAALLKVATQFEGRQVAPQDLHVTVLHIGKLEKLYSAIREEVEISEYDFLNAVQALVCELESLKAEYADYSFALDADRFELFGIQKSVLVIRLLPTKALLSLHARSLEILKTCLQACGIHDPDGFIRNNQSLRYSLEFQPHVGIARNVTDIATVTTELPALPLSFSVMDIVYAT